MFSRWIVTPNERIFLESLRTKLHLQTSDTVRAVLRSLSSCVSCSLCCYKFKGQDQGSVSGCMKLWQATSAECHMNMEHEGHTGTHQAPGRLAKQPDDIWYAPPELHLRATEPKAVCAQICLNPSEVINSDWTAVSRVL